MFNVYHYNHWSSGSAVVVATSQVLAGGFKPEDEESAALAFVPVASFDTETEAVAEARRLAGQKAEEYRCTMPTVDGSPVLFALKF